MNALKAASHIFAFSDVSSIGMPNGLKLNMSRLHCRSHFRCH